MATPETNESGNGREAGRGASGGKIFNGRSKVGKSVLGSRLDPKDFCNGGNVHRSRVHLAVCKQRDNALVTRFVRIVMHQFVQRRAGRHRIQHQNKRRQGQGDSRLAELVEMAIH